MQTVIDARRRWLDGRVSPSELDYLETPEQLFEDSLQVAGIESAGLGMSVPLANDFDALEPWYASGLALDRLVFDAGVRPEDLRFSWSVANTGSEHAVLGIEYGTDSRVKVVLPHADDPIGVGVELFEFADGAVLKLPELLALADRQVERPTLDPQRDGDTLVGRPGMVDLRGFAGNDTLDGNGAVFDLRGGAGSDTYHYDRGDGFIRLYEASDAPGDVNTLTFGPGITPDDFLAGWINWSPDYDKSVSVRFDLGNDATHADEGFRIHTDAHSGHTSIERFVFADGTVWTREAFEDVALGRAHAPTAAEMISTQTAAEGEAFSFAIAPDAFVDPDAADHLTLRVSLAGGAALPGWLRFDPASATLSGTPPVGTGSLDLTVQARDRYGFTANAGITLAVSGNPQPPANRVPQLVAPLADQSTAQGQPFVFAVPSGTFSDPDPGDKLTYAATRVNGDPLPAWLSFDAATHTFSGTPGNADVGTLSVSLAATDAGGLAVNDVFDLAIADVNDAPAPQVSVPAQSATETIEFAYTLPPGAFLDVDAADSFTLSASLQSGEPLPAWLDFDAAAGRFSGTPPIGEIGALAVRVTARDTSGATGTLGFEVNVAAAPAQMLFGSVGANTLTGLSGDDTLDGGPGADTLIGGKGGDSYFVDNSGDSVIELPAEGNDTVNTTVNFALPNEVENLVLAGTADLRGYGNALANVLTGNAGANSLAGGAGDDTLYGLDGADQLYGDEGADLVYGGAGNDRIYGWSGDDWLDGGEGADKLYGDDGNDFVFGAGGDDVLYGWTGEDYLAGGEGVDRLEGEAGNDLMQGGAGADTLYDVEGSNLFDGGLDNDKLIGGAGADIFIGGGGDDTINTGTGSDILVFNRGDGQDSVLASTGQDNTLSIGGGIGYSDMALAKSGNSLVLNLGGTDKITLRDWYTEGIAGERYKSVATLQMIADAMADFDAAGNDPLLNQRAVSFDFAGLADAFEAARVANPSLSSWALTQALTQFYLDGSDDAALGGALAYQYGHAGTFSGTSVDAAQGVLAQGAFGAERQLLRPFEGMQRGGLTMS